MQEPLNSSYPVLPLRDIVVFPHMIVPLFVGREKSVRALEEVMADDKQILLSSQIDPSVDEPDAAGIYKAGVLANVLQLLKLPDGTVRCWSRAWRGCGSSNTSKTRISLRRAPNI